MCLNDDNLEWGPCPRYTKELTACLWLAVSCYNVPCVWCALPEQAQSVWTNGMPKVKLYLFGNPRLERDGGAVSIRRRKSVALLAYLALSEQSHSREALAALIWPEYDQSNARGNLRRELSRLRQDVGEEFLAIERQQVDVDEDAGLWVDVQRFRKCLALVEEHDHFPRVACAQCLAALQEAVVLHSDTFMAGFTLPDAPAFDEWQFYTSENLLRRLSSALQLLVDYHRNRKEYEEAAGYARRWLMQDPLHEAAQRQLMALYAYSGRTAAALRQYEEYARLLEEELGVPPEEETTELYHAIQGRQFPPARKNDSTGEMLSLAMDPARRFVVREQMPSGGQGALFRGVDRVTGEPVVIKQLRPDQLNNPDYVTRFEREGEMLRRLNHPNIVRVLATYDHEERHCLVMEYVAGGSLRDLLATEGSLPAPRALEIGVELADALSRAHHLGIIHRDVKPANVLMAEDGTPRLTDFGLARLRQQRLDLTPTGTLLGSPYYMSPEALRGEELDERSDIWSFGALLFEMLAGRPPFPGRQMAQIMMSILNDPVPSLADVCPDISPGLVALLRRMLTKDRAARIFSMRLIAAGMEALRDERVGMEILTGDGGMGTVGDWNRETGDRGLETEGGRRTGAPQTGAAPRSAAPRLEGPRIGPGRSGEVSLFVGRQTELEALMGQLERALAGRPHAAFIVGGAGAGKTALMQSFARQAQDAVPELLIAGGEGNAFTGSGNPFLPFREILEMLTGEVRAPSAYGQASAYDTQRLQRAAPLATRALVEVGPDLVKTMLSPERLLQRAGRQGNLESADGRTENGEENVAWVAQLRALAEQWSLQQTLSGVTPSALFEQYARVLQQVAQERPLLLLLDDLQWVDEGSANLLLHLGKRLGSARLLLVGAYRPGDVAQRREDGQHSLQWTINELQRGLDSLVVDLSQAEGLAFVEALLDAYPNRLGDDFRMTLLRLTRGNPLFTIELLRGMQERGDLVQDEEGAWIVGPALDWQTLPARAEGAIGERLGRLDRQLQEILQVASVEGEEFTAEVAAQVLGLQRREVVRLLSRELDRQHRVVRSLGIVHNGVQRLSRYGFRHNLIQRYLYNGLDEVERVYQHEEVGRALAELYGDQVQNIAMELALHFEQAALTPETVAYLQMAAEQALRRGAYAEAMRRLERAKALLKTLPDGRLRAGLELGVQALLGPAIVTTRGMADREAEAAYVRAMQLAERLDDAPQLSSVLFGLATIREFQGRYAESQALLERRLQLPQAGEDTALRMESRELLACSTFHQGLFAEALEHAREGLALYEPQAHDTLIPLHGHNLQPACFVWESQALWFLGYGQRSMTAMDEALLTARALGHDFSLCTMLVQAAFLYQFRREPRAVREAAREALAMATTQGYPYRAAEARVLLGWAQVMDGGAEDGAGESPGGLGLLAQGLEEIKALGGRIDLPYFMGLQAEALAAAGRKGPALQVLEEALAGEGEDGKAPFFYDAELSRMRAGLLLELGGAASAPAAEACLRQALKTAERQGARMPALRAALDLARLWQEQGRGDEARALLSEHYEWFEEGLEMEDLRRAAALLEELGAGG